MRNIIGSIEGEYRRYKKLAEAAMAQVAEVDLSRQPPGRGNSIAMVVWHLSGNLTSRFTDFLTTDGEKPWRKRDEEFNARAVSRTELQQKWERGWEVLFDVLTGLDDTHLTTNVAIRGLPLRVDEALHRSLTHIAYHIGQIVYQAKILEGQDWSYLSIAPGRSEEYNKAPTREKG